MKKIHKLQFRLAKGWVVAQDNFYKIEPDNKLPIGKVYGYFSEHLFQARYGTYVIDVGFYGTYHLNREGHFGLYLIKGDFQQGILLEKHNCRSMSQMNNLLQALIDQVTEGAYEKTKGLKFGADTFLVGLKQYSAKGSVGFKYWY